MVLPRTRFISISPLCFLQSQTRPNSGCHHGGKGGRRSSSEESEYHPKRIKSYGEGQKPHGFTHMLDMKQKATNEQTGNS